MIRAASPMGLFERYLTLWVALCILAGLALGNLMPELFSALAAIEYASVNLIVAVLIWAMVYPMMIAIDLGSLKAVGRRPKGLVITLTINWLIKPFTMAALAVLFFEYLLADLINLGDAQQYIAGLILLGAAPCTAMVFVWSQMTRGDPNYTLVQVSVNNLVMVVAFAPIVALLLGFAQRNRGMTRVLIGDALVNEKERLQLRINQLLDKVEASIKQALRVAATQDRLSPDADFGALANLLLCYVIGRWQQYAKSGFVREPLVDWPVQWPMLLVACLSQRSA